MTKKSILLALLMLVSLAVSAQFRYAPVVGVTVNDLKFSQNLFPVSQQAGMQAGVMAEMMFPGIGFGIDFGLLYNQMGATNDLGARKVWSSDGFGRARTEVHAIQIPAHLRFKWTRMQGFEDYLAPFVYGGPDFNIAVGHNKIKGNDGVGSPYLYSGGDFGLTAGGGAEIFKDWQLSVQYTWGMTDIMKTAKLDNLAANNRQWAIRIAYLF